MRYDEHLKARTSIRAMIEESSPSDDTE